MHLQHEEPNMSRARSSLRTAQGTSFGVCQEKTTGVFWVQNTTRQLHEGDPQGQLGGETDTTGGVGEHFYDVATANDSSSITGVLPTMTKPVMRMKTQL